MHIRLRSSISIIACPLGVASDCREDVYNAPSLYGRTLTNSTFQSFVCDITLSTVVRCLTVIVWWSTWSLVDYLEKHLHFMNDLDTFESREQHIFAASIILGYILCVSAYLLQVRQQLLLITKESYRLKIILRIVIRDLSTCFTYHHALQLYCQ